jgi:hypothetical protein
MRHLLPLYLKNSLEGRKPLKMMRELLKKGLKKKRSRLKGVPHLPAKEIRLLKARAKKKEERSHQQMGTHQRTLLKSSLEISLRVTKWKKAHLLNLITITKRCWIR